MKFHKRLFFVVNPTQYLHAVEFAYQHPDSENHLLVISPYMQGILAIDKFGTKDLWRKSYSLDTSSYLGNKQKNWWRDTWSFLYSVYRKTMPKTLIAGNLIDSLIYPFLLRESSNLDKIVILDDGTPTLGIAKNRHHKTDYRKYNCPSIRNSTKWLWYLKTLPQLKKRLKPLHFFSLFDVNFDEDDQVIRNNFDWLKSKKRCTDVVDEHLFIGSNLVDRGVVAEVNYFNSLQQVKNHTEAANVPMVYQHHRGESERIRKSIQKIFNTRDSKLPLEFAFLEHPKPTLIGGHFTSALFSLSRIYPEISCNAFLFPESQLIGTENEPADYLHLVQSSLTADSAIKTHQL